MDCLQAQQYAKAFGLLQHALNMLTQPPSSRRLVALTYNNIGCYYKRLNEHTKALKFLRTALEIEVNTPADATNLAGTHLNICAILSKLKQHGKAYRHASAALDLLSTVQPSPAYISTLVIAFHNAGVELEFLQELNEAMEAYHKGWQVAEKHFGGKNVLTESLQMSFLAVRKKMMARDVKTGRKRSRRQRLEISPKLNRTLPSLNKSSYDYSKSIRSPRPIRFELKTKVLKADFSSSSTRSREGYYSKQAQLVLTRPSPSTTVFNRHLAATKIQAWWRSLTKRSHTKKGPNKPPTSKPKRLPTKANKPEPKAPYNSIDPKDKLIVTRLRSFTDPKLTSKNRAATIIQSHVRMWMVRRLYVSIKEASVFIQQQYRLYRNRLRPKILCKMFLRHVCGRFFRACARLDRVEEFVLPQPGEGIVEVEVLRWLKRPGESVKEYEVLCEARSDKGFIEYKAAFDGVLTKVFYQESEMAKIGSPLYGIETNTEKSADIPLSSSSEEEEHQRDEGLRGKVQTSPAVRHIAKVNKIDLTAITPTGPKGRILKCDLLEYIESKIPTKQPTDSPKPADLPPARQTKHDKTYKVTAQQRGMIKSMTEALKIPHLTYCDELKIDRLLKIRSQLKSRLGKLTLSPFFIKAMSLAILDFPIVNASFTQEDCNEYRVYESHNISIAIDSPIGLVVPNIKNCERLSISEISAELNRLIELAVEGRLSTSDLQGGTIALSNIGSIGGTYSRPVILPPQVVIGALGRHRPVLALKNNTVIEEQTLPISWSADHRLLDGATIARFSNRWKELIEDPTLMLLHLK